MAYAAIVVIMTGSTQSGMTTLYPTASLIEKVP